MNPSPAGAPGSTRTRSAALDGLRGLALIGMMAWHAEIGWVKGGFARMTIFFVLAGFLATRSYLSIRSRGGARPFATFWARRARRLLPITVLGVAVAVAVTIWIGSNRAQQSLVGDTASVLGNVSNWRFMVDDRSYGAMFENPSAFSHFWSLSVEEQWFLAIPLVLAAAAWVGTRREAWGRHVVAGAAIALAAVPLLVPHTPDQAYFGTHVRGAEFLTGAWLALWLDHRSEIGWSERHRRLLARSGLASLVLLVAVMVLVDRTQPWLYQGGMALFAVPAALVIAACITGAPTLERVLGIVPLRWLGVAALSIYALHWPLFQVVDHLVSPLPFTALVLIQLMVAVGIGSLVHVLIERPLLPGSRTRPIGVPAITNRMVLVPAGAAMAVVLVVVLVRPAPAPTYDFEAAQAEVITRSEGAGAIGERGATSVDNATVAASADAANLAVFGGSSALMLGLSEWEWANPRADVRDTIGYTRLGCGVLTGGERRVLTESADPDQLDASERFRPPAECLDWRAEWSDAVERNRVDVALVLFGAWDTADWMLDSDDQWRSVGDAVIDEALIEGLGTGLDQLTASGVRQVILATTPVIGPGESGDARDERTVPADQEERTERFNDLLRSVAAERPEVHLIEYGAVIDGLDAEESGRLFPDGVHPTTETAGAVWQRHLGPLIHDVLGR